MQIRAAHPNDIAILSEYWYDQMVIWQQSSRNLRLLPGARTQWEQHAQIYFQQPNVVFLVADAGQEVVGGIIGEIMANQPGFAPAEIGMIHVLIVDNHTEVGRGAGRMLWDACAERMRQQGVEQLQVSIPAQAVVQQAFWRGVGGQNVMDVFWVTI